MGWCQQIGRSSDLGRGGDEPIDSQRGGERCVARAARAFGRGGQHGRRRQLGQGELGGRAPALGPLVALDEEPIFAIAARQAGHPLITQKALRRRLDDQRILAVAPDRSYRSGIDRGQSPALLCDYEQPLAGVCGLRLNEQITRIPASRDGGLGGAERARERSRARAGSPAAAPRLRSER